MGSTLINMLYFILQLGIIPSINILYLYYSICFYTASIIVKRGGKDNDYTDTVYTYFGKVGNIGKVLQIIFNLSINIGATFNYLVLLIKIYFLVLLFYNIKFLILKILLLFLKNLLLFIVVLVFMF